MNGFGLMELDREAILICNCDTQTATWVSQQGCGRLEAPTSTLLVLNSHACVDSLTVVWIRCLAYEAGVASGHEEVAGCDKSVFGMIDR
jgi:hypothetical protein